MVYDQSSLERCEKARVVGTGWNEGNEAESGEEELLCFCRLLSFNHFSMDIERTFEGKHV